jgi:very-short-patch-repair endonuclease
LYYGAKSFIYPRKLRRDQTGAEKIVWSILRNNQLGCKFRRQHAIGDYIVDFICVEKSLIIEIDVGQHNDEVDKPRSDFLEKSGFKIIRFWNNEVSENREGVYNTIKEKIDRS